MSYITRYELFFFYWLFLFILHLFYLYLFFRYIFKKLILFFIFTLFQKLSIIFIEQLCYLSFLTLTNSLSFGFLPNSNMDKLDIDISSFQPSHVDITQNINAFHKWISIAKLQSKQYQIDGLSWLLQNELNPNPFYNIRGGFIADEMGLGKTIQSIGLIYSNFLPKTLIVVPLAILQQWQHEILRLLGHHAFIFHGNNIHNLQALQNAPIVITTYGHISIRKLKNNLIQLSQLHTIQWNRIIFDEGHKLRNRKSLSAIGARNLQSPIKWIISGTPIQNSQNDFFNLAFIIGFHPKFTKNYYSFIVKHFMLYRTKKDVHISLPPIHFHDIPVSWHNIHEKSLAQNIHSALPFSDGSLPDFTNPIFDSINSSHLTSIIRARQSCILPALINKSIYSITSLQSFDSKHIQDALISTSSSSKINAVIDTIFKRKHNGNRKILFCHFTYEIITLFKLLSPHFNVAFIDGSTSSSSRHAFTHDLSIDILILQIQSCSEGINLQHFSEVYFISPHWNPAIHSQAIARAHRIGQTKDVHVFRFFMLSPFHNSISIDQFCYQSQAFKLHNASIILNQHSYSPSLLNHTQISMLHDDCPICLSPFHSSQHVISTSCKHHFHISCIHSWITTLRKKNSHCFNCPSCRNNLSFHDIHNILS
jgi:SNF2 family DNA or RNA helicase